MSADAFVALLRSDRISTFVANLETTLFRADFGEMAIPCTLNDGAPTCYICCPSRAYVDYARAEMSMLGPSPLLTAATMPLLSLARMLVRQAGLDRQVQINNWLIATNPVPHFSERTLSDLLGRLVTAHPDHAILWRSLDPISDGGLLEIMRANGWVHLAARRVYLFDCRADLPRIGRDETRDRIMLRSSSYTISDGAAWEPADFVRAAELYGLLYLQKYTPLNPQYTAAFLSGLTRAGLLELKALRSPDGRIDGIIGFFDGGDVMTAPIVGYETKLPQTTGLYRMLMSLAFQRARQRRMLFNASAGADSFKRNRGAIPVVEYTAVYNRHLPFRRRAAAAILAHLLTRIAVPLMERFVA